ILSNLDSHKRLAMLSKDLVGLVLSAMCGLLITAARADEATPPYRRVLTAAQTRRVNDLQKEMASLTAAGKFTEAQKLAEEELHIRTAAQGKGHWETVNARFAVEALKAVS